MRSKEIMEMNKKADTGPQGSGEKEARSLEVSETALRFRVERRGLASLLYAVLRPKDAKAAFVNVNSLNLMHGSGYTEIPIEDISSVQVETGQYWSRIRFYHTAGIATVSGLSRDGSREFTEVLETARISCWRRTLETEVAELRSILQHLEHMANPPEHMASVFLKLRRDAEKAVNQFAERWPKSLPNAPETQLLKKVEDFLEDPERLRAEVNNTFVESELKRSREFFDRIEARPLTEEQRRAVVVDEDRNLVVRRGWQRKDLGDRSQGRLASPQEVPVPVGIAAPGVCERRPERNGRKDSKASRQCSC